MARSGVPESLSPLTLKGIRHPNLYRIPIIGDGSCFFHAVLRSFYRDYIESTQKSVRQFYARHLRNALSAVLEESNPLTGIRYYDELSRGTLATLAAEGLSSCSISAMQQELQQGGPVDNLYQELVSNHLNRDIYIVNEDYGDVDVGFSDLELLYKGRNSIILLYRNGHYELLGIAVPNSTTLVSSGDRAGSGSPLSPEGLVRLRQPLETFFTPSHPLIQQLYQRMVSLISERTSQDPESQICFAETVIPTQIPII